MKDRFNTIEDILTGGLFGSMPEQNTEKTNHILKSTRLENEIFREMLSDCDGLRELQETGSGQLSTFPDLTRDVFTAFYTLFLNRQDDDTLSEKTKRFNKPILEDLLQDAEFNAVKAICEGRELPAFAAAEEFCGKILEKLPELLKAAGGGNPETLRVIDNLNEQAENLQEELQNLMQQAESAPELEKKAVKTANRLDSKLWQIHNLEKAVQDNLTVCGPLFKAAVQEASVSAQEKAQETADAIRAWGDGSGEMGNTPLNRELLQRVHANARLQEVARILGRYREIIADKRKNCFSYGLGEKYDITNGNDVNLCLASELALLASPETESLFIQKYRQKNLRQYRKRQAVSKGIGDIIVCVDESSSMKEVSDWAKAFALALLDIAGRDHRKFALVHFASANEIQTNRFFPGEYALEDVLRAAEHNFNGGTDFEAPLTEAIRMIGNGFEQADIVFITDGECAVAEGFTDRFQEDKQRFGFQVTGILLDKEDSSVGASLISFCDRIYRSSELTGDDIAIRIFEQSRI